MDTRNITVAPSKRSILIEKILEIGFCWVYPAVLMVTYYIVQPFRYYIFGISGCTAVFDSSWPSLAIVWVWGCITTLVAAFYSGLLGFRLFRYRREFHDLIAARNTTKSRFIRLFLMALYVSIILVPYSFFILYQLADTIVDEYSWARVHGPDWNSVIKVPANGVARWDRWGEVAAGYITFLLFGTGTDAHNTYKGLLTSIGFGKIFPSLYIISESSGIQTPTSVTFVKRWTSNWSSKAKSLLSKNGSVSELSCNASVTGSVTQTMFTNENTIPSQQHHGLLCSDRNSFFSRIFHRRTMNQYILPSHSKISNETDRLPVLDKTRSNPSAFAAHAWATDDLAGEKHGEMTGVHVVREVHQAIQEQGKRQKTIEDSQVHSH
ncbi:hypothetical protein SLS60_003309 [Paraconiothyrium brasiliense]|uniref:Pheromone a factor receptor n=1 Tax=Paraconiothyrium brasiliense TaxID=300254 RepID=A0ABR3RVS8_9PLEO